MKHLIGHTRNGIAVHVDLIQSHAARHIAERPHLLHLVAEALQKTMLSGADANIEHDMGRVIGYSFVITTSDADNVFYAQLVRDDTYTRFIKNGKPSPTHHLSMVLRHNQDSTYELSDAWIGPLCPPRPGTVNETPESKPYWSAHAILLSNESLQLRTITRVCPY